MHVLVGLPILFRSARTTYVVVGTQRQAGKSHDRAMFVRVAVVTVM